MIEFLGIEIMKKEKSLLEKQQDFVIMVMELIRYARLLNYGLTFGDAWSKPEYNAHKKNSKHYDRLAVDFNLFINGVWRKDTESHKPLGIFWENLGGKWGGRFKNPDGNHYEY